MPSYSKKLTNKLKLFLGIKEETSKEIKDWLSRHDNLGNRLILSLLVISISFILLTRIPNISFDDFVLNFSTEILGAIVTIFLIEWFLNEREKKKKLVIRLIMEKDFESIKYSFYDFLYAVMPQILGSKLDKVSENARNLMLSFQPDYSHIHKVADNIRTPFLVDDLLRSDSRLDDKSLKELAEVATKLLSLCEKKMNLYGAIYLEDSFLRLFSILSSANNLVEAIKSYESRVVGLEKGRDILFGTASDAEFEKMKYQTTKQSHDIICDTLANCLMHLARLWTYMENVHTTEGRIDEKLTEFWRQTRTFS